MVDGFVYKKLSKLDMEMQLTRTARKVRVRRRQSIVDKGWQATEEPTLDSGFSKQLNSISPKPDTTCWSRKSRVVL